MEGERHDKNTSGTASNSVSYIKSNGCRILGAVSHTRTQPACGERLMGKEECTSSELTFLVIKAKTSAFVSSRTSRVYFYYIYAHAQQTRSWQNYVRGEYIQAWADLIDKPCVPKKLEVPAPRNIHTSPLSTQSISTQRRFDLSSDKFEHKIMQLLVKTSWLVRKFPAQHKNAQLYENFGLLGDNL